MHWCYMAGPKLVEFGVWWDVDPTKLLMPTLSEKEAKQYEELVKLKLPKIALTDSRNIDWLFALLGNGNTIRFSLAFIFFSLFILPLFVIRVLVIRLLLCFSNLLFFLYAVSTREALIEQRKKKAREKRAAELLAEEQKAGGAEHPAVDHPEGASLDPIQSPPILIEVAVDATAGLWKWKLTLGSGRGLEVISSRHTSPSGGFLSRISWLVQLLNRPKRWLRTFAWV